MSCITKLLEMKGDKKCLPINNRSVIEGGGIYNDYEYLITFTSHGARCGYVAIPEGQDYDSSEISCHGGLTFEGDDHGTKYLLPIPCSDTWLGFDCAHAYDGYDKELAQKYFGKQTFSDDFYTAMSGFGLRDEVTHRTYDYVEKECQSIIDQLMGQGYILAVERCRAVLRSIMKEVE